MGYSIILTTTPPLSFWGIIIEDSYAAVNEIFQRFGVVEFKIVPMKEPPLIRDETKFWKEHIDWPLSLLRPGGRVDDSNK